MLLSRIKSRCVAFLVATLLFFALLQRSYRSFGAHRHRYRYRHALDKAAFQSLSGQSYKDDVGFLSYRDAAGLCRAHNWAAYPRKYRKIYDLFMVNNEVDMLTIRMNELHHRVDYFVIIQSNYTFTGLLKPLLPDKIWGNFKPFQHKIIHRTLVEPGRRSTRAWDHEDFQRNAMFVQIFPTHSGDQKPELGDVIIISDVDEIPRPETLVILRNCDFPRRLTLRSRFYYYSFQWLHRGHEWAHPQATIYDGDKTIKPANLRNGEGITAVSTWLASKDKADLWNAAWHCSYCFRTLEEMLHKIRSSSHISYNTAKFRDRKGIVRRLRGGRDIFDRKGEEYDLIEENTDIPGFLKIHSQKYEYMRNRDREDAGFIDFKL